MVEGDAYVYTPAFFSRTEGRVNRSAGGARAYPDLNLKKYDALARRTPTTHAEHVCTRYTSFFFFSDTLMGLTAMWPRKVHKDLSPPPL